jgi:cysteine desulfurase
MIYLDHNATTPLDARVLEAMMPYLQDRWGNPSSPYRFGNQAKAAVEKSREQIADCMGCKPSEIIFTSSGTESDNLAVRGVVRAVRSHGNHIVTSAIEHHALLHTCKALEEDGCRVSNLPVSADGVIRLEDLERILKPETILVSIMHANNETGVLQPVEEIAALLKNRGIVFHTDAVQSAGKIPLSLSKLGADLVSFSGHKIYGPKGTAALIVREGTPLDPLITGGPHERGLRAGTENVAGIVGLSKAVSMAVESLESESKRLQNLRDKLERRICSELPDVKVNGVGALRVPNTTNLSFDSVDGESVVLDLDLRGICVSTGSACSTGDPEPSHVLLAMGLAPKQAQGSIRISLGRHTREEDIDIVVDDLVDTVERLRVISSLARPRMMNTMAKSPGNGDTSIRGGVSPSTSELFKA